LCSILFGSFRAPAVATQISRSPLQASKFFFGNA
jgi:hypothetical protein